TAVTLLGLPLALILAWAFEVTPEGVQRTDAATPGEIEEIVAQPMSKRWPAGLAALVGLTALLAGAWWVGTRTGPPGTESTPESSVRLALADLADDPRPSIAVLPFVNMSADEEQEYFSDGITEEVLNVLAKLPELRVAARTSAFAFKGSSVDLRTVGDSLGVGYLIEGSVRKAGDEVRITAQLIDAADGSHLWSDSYTRTLENIFQIQAEIAEAIAAELRVPLGIEDPSTLVTPTGDIEAYDLYLAGRARVRERGESLREANQLFKAAIARDSTWVPAWAGLAESLELTGWYWDAWDETPADDADLQEWLGIRDSLWVEAERTARRALELDSNSASAHVALGSVLRNAHRWEESEEAYLRALRVDPDSPEAHQQYGNMLLDMGRIVEGRRAVERAVALDRTPIRIVWQTNGLLLDGELEKAHEVLVTSIREFPDFEFLRTTLEGTLVMLGRWDEWIDMAPDDSARAQRRRIAEGDLSSDVGFVGGALEAAMMLGYPDTTVVWLSGVATAFSPTLLWQPLFDPLREDAVYLETLREVNLEGAVPQRTPR
ncbi:MAG: tetratricopeptide repeat protein, partial [Gemmatimonadota bacterium]